GQIDNPVQNIPGQIYISESGFMLPIANGQVAGLADFGTRLKATFNNIPAGARVFVSASNVTNSGLPVLAPPSGGLAGSSIGNATVAGYIGYAQLVNGESTSDGNAGAGGFPAVATTDL